MPSHSTVIIFINSVYTALVTVLPPVEISADIGILNRILNFIAKVEIKD